MALNISSKRVSTSMKLTWAFLALFALFIQPLVAVNIPSAFALNEVMPPAEKQIIVHPSGTKGWVGIEEDGQDHGLQNYRPGPDTPPLGKGSAAMLVENSNQSHTLAKSGVYGGTKLADIAALEYSTYTVRDYTVSGNDYLASSMELNVTPDVNGTAASYGKLIYEPYRNTADGKVSDNTWHTWDAASSKWWLSEPSAFGGNCGQSSPCTFDQLISYNTNIGINTGEFAGVGFKIGSGVSSYYGSVDNFHFASSTSNDRYNFEWVADLAAPTNLKPTSGTITNNPNFVLSWDKVPEAVGYIYRGSTALYPDGTLNWDVYNDGEAHWMQPELYTISDTTVTRKNTRIPEGDWYWQARATDGYGNAVSPWSAISKVTADYTAATATVTYSPNGPTKTNKNVIVTLTVSEPIKQSALPPGTWLKKSATVYQKSYPANTVQNVTLKDLAGNVGSTTVTINWINKGGPAKPPLR